MNDLLLNHYLDYLPVGLLFFNSQGELIWLNQKAYRVLEVTKSAELSKASEEGSTAIICKAVHKMIHSDSDMIVSDMISVETRFGQFEAMIYPMYVPKNASMWVCSLQQTPSDSKSLDIDNLHEFIHGISAPVSNLTAWLKALLEGNDQQKHFLLEPERLKILYHRAETTVKMLNNYLFNESLVIENDDSQSHKIDLHLMLHELMESFSWKAREKSLLIEEKFCEEQLFIHANPLYIETLFTILIDNAIKYNCINGRIVISTYYNSESIQVHVQDSGIGIEEKDVNLIFNDFFRSAAVQKERLPGSGLGLSIAHKIVKMYEADISVSSQLGKGTEFTVEFPCS